MTTLLENGPRTDDAFRTLVARYINLVYSAALRQLRDAHLAEDATQAVFILLYSRENPIPADRLSGWLLTTTRFTCANIRRTQRRRARREQERAAMTPTIHSPDDAAAESADLLRMLDDALAHLSVKDREAIALHYLQDQPYAIVGDALGLSEEAARKRVTRALDKLRARFARHGIPATPPAALATLLQSQAHTAALVPATIDRLTKSILTTCRTGAPAPALAIAKGTHLMMLTHTVKTVAVPVAIGLALFAAGWWGKSALTRAEPPHAGVAAFTPIDLSTPESTLASYVAAMKAGDRAALDNCVTRNLTPAAPTAEEAVCSLMLAQNHLIAATAKAFHTDGHEARLFATIDLVLEKVIAYERATHQTATIDGTTATLPFKLPEAQIAAFPAEIQPEIRAFVDMPMRFEKQGDQWKLLHSPGASSQARIDLLDKKEQPITDAQTKVSVVEDYAAMYDRIATDIAGGSYASWEDVAAAIQTAKADFHNQHHLSDIEIHLEPPKK